MSPVRPLPAKVQRLIEDLNNLFWDHWQKETARFPDTLDSSVMSLVALQSSIISICTNYILGFEAQKRMDYLEDLIKSLRYMEMQLRDLNDDYT